MNPQVTIFTPAYNRVDTLERLYKSILIQEIKDFEWIIVDDGSTDNTEDLINSFVKEEKIDIRYFYQKNSGKHVARNFALEKAKGKFFFTIDSDDMLLKDTLLKLMSAWNNYSKLDKGIVGVEAHTIDLKEKKILGSVYKKDILVSNHLDTRVIDGISGDKLRMIKTEVFRKHKFPVFKNENFVPEGFVWNEIGRSHKMLYINDIIAVVDYQKSGISFNSIKIRASNPIGMTNYYLNYKRILQEKFGKKVTKIIFKTNINIFRFYFHCSVSKRESLRKTYKLNFPINLFYCMGFAFYLKDKLFLRRHYEKK